MAASKIEGRNDNGGNKFKFLLNLKPRPFTTDNILSWYVPAIGGVSYTLFSVHIFNANFLESLFPKSKYMVANVLLFNSHLGTLLYLSKSKHLTLSSVQYRATYGIYGALLFNFGSILLWAVTKSILPEEGFVRTIFSVSSSICMLLVGREYIQHVDNWCSKKN